MPKKETYNKTKNIPLHPKFVNWLCDHFQTDNASEAIRKGIHGFLTKSSYSKRMDDFALHQIILTVEERTTIKKYSIRITDDMDKAIKAYATNDTGFNTVTVMLANYLYFSSAAQAPSTPAKASSLPAPGKFEPDYSMKLLPLAGSKWSPVMQDAIKKIFESSGKRWQTSIDAFVGALGIFSNFKVADHEVINDIDLRKVNLDRLQ